VSRVYGRGQAESNACVILKTRPENDNGKVRLVRPELVFPLLKESEKFQQLILAMKSQHPEQTNECHCSSSFNIKDLFDREPDKTSRIPAIWQRIIAEESILS